MIKLLLVFVVFSLQQSHVSMSGASSIFAARGSNNFVPDTLVLAIDHYIQEAELNDTEVKGNEWDNRFYRIRTPLTTVSSVMYRFTMIGYAFGVAKPLDCVWVGHLSTTHGSLLQSFEECRYSKIVCN